ncbi:MAG TPA: hypothetical protein K8V91_01825 [[Clostridium] spiroforme]|uniref:Uncharacterized protein n=1 Tax=Thomasclavelia spiroformis TaxID=29348 RepID=A0A921KHZ2_9FIRM|nr:hypothetical protein [Thomasclavelia spiroformis]
MIYIIMFIVMCWLDWKLDTYAAFKFLGTWILGGLIFVGSLMLYSDKQTEVSTTQETFISGNFSEEIHKMNSSQTVFTYATETGTKSIEANQILSFKKNQKENKVIITKYEYPKIAKVLFFMIGGDTTYRVELKEK